MRTDSSASNVTANTMSASPFKSQLFHLNNVVYNSLYSPSTYSSDSVNSNSVSNSNSNSDSNRLYHSQTLQEHQEIVNRNLLYLTLPSRGNRRSGGSPPREQPLPRRQPRAQQATQPPHPRFAPLLRHLQRLHHCHVVFYSRCRVSKVENRRSWRRNERRKRSRSDPLG